MSNMSSSSCPQEEKLSPNKLKMDTAFVNISSTLEEPITISGISSNCYEVIKQCVRVHNFVFGPTRCHFYPCRQVWEPKTFILKTINCTRILITWGALTTTRASEPFCTMPDKLIIISILLHQLNLCFFAVPNTGNYTSAPQWSRPPCGKHTLQFYHLC